jgi:NAD(P)-dependent dehydrogenase (short-subunit alcohol dehydrogenase family)
MSLTDLFDLSGKAALVTGGAGLYGRQIVFALAGAGARTYVASRDVSALETLACEPACRGRVVALPLDQGREDSILALHQELKNREDAVDILVNNAVSRPMLRGYEDTAESFESSMRVNATGLFLITRVFGDWMAERRRGSIINIGSIQGMVGPDPSVYSGTEMHGWYPDYFFHKGGMINYTRFVASYYGRWNVRCNCLSPGGFQTAKHPDAFVRQYSGKTCLGRMAGEGDLMGPIMFLASDASVYVTGVNLPVDGGYTAK